MAYFAFTRKLLVGEPIEVFGEGKMARDFTYIDDIVTGVVGALDHPPTDGGHRVLNIGGGIAGGADGHDRGVGTRSGLDGGQGHAADAAGDVTATYADVSKLAALTGYAPKVGIDQGLTRFVEWYRGFYGSAG